jgi:hypothetical protein
VAWLQSWLQSFHVDSCPRAWQEFWQHSGATGFSVRQSRWPDLVVGNELRERLSGRVPPADAEWMPGRVRVHLVALGGIEIRSRSEQSGAEGDCLFVRGSRIVGVEVEMHLLGSPIRPVGRNMVRRQLHTDPPLSSAVDDAVPIVVLEDVPAENASPERTLGIKVGCIEHDHLAHHVHERHTTRVIANWTISLGTGLSCFADHSVCSSEIICLVRECPPQTASDRAIGHVTGTLDVLRWTLVGFRSLAANGGSCA